MKVETCKYPYSPAFLISFPMVQFIVVPIFISEKRWGVPVAHSDSSAEPIGREQIEIYRIADHKNHPVQTHQINLTRKLRCMALTLLNSLFYHKTIALPMIDHDIQHNFLQTYVSTGLVSPQENVLLFQFLLIFGLDLHVLVLQNTEYHQDWINRIILHKILKNRMRHPFSALYLFPKTKIGQ